MITIILADDHVILRQGLRTLLEQEADFQVVAETGDGLEALGLVDRHRPDVLIVDMVMPGLSGLDVIRSVTERRQQTRMIVLSMHGNEAYVVEALHLGASGYLLKESSASELIQAVREVVAGRRYLTSSLAERALDAYVTSVAQSSAHPYELLTERERQVLQLAAEGLANAQIAERLSIGVRTVETHRANLMSKLSLKSHSELIRFVMQRGLLK